MLEDIEPQSETIVKSSIGSEVSSANIGPIAAADLLQIWQIAKTEGKYNCGKNSDGLKYVTVYTIVIHILIDSIHIGIRDENEAIKM